MKLFALLITLTVSLPSLGHTHKLTFNSPNLEVKPVLVAKPIQTNLIRLYMRMPSEMRMIAGYKEVRTKQISEDSTWLGGLRNRLKSTNGKIRL
ncbi:MAG: hypothetical protein H0V66_02510 [Bdellovibrionales bacterium]|nr:hypothetical protein [Bdellovibrionales bacterium]